LGISQAAALRWGARDWVENSKERIAALKGSGGLPPPPMPPIKPTKNARKSVYIRKPKRSAAVLTPGQDGPF
jgi:hypothetical protein